MKIENGTVIDSNVWDALNGNSKELAEFRDRLSYIYAEEVEDYILIKWHKKHNKNFYKHLAQGNMLPARVERAVEREMDRLIGRLLADIYSKCRRRQVPYKSRGVRMAFKEAELTFAGAEVMAVLSGANQSLMYGPSTQDKVYRFFGGVVRTRLEGADIDEVSFSCLSTPQLTEDFLLNGGELVLSETVFYNPVILSDEYYAPVGYGKVFDAPARLIMSWLKRSVKTNVSLAPLARASFGYWRLF